MALLSVLILSTTGYGYATLSNLRAGLKTNDVISKGVSAPDGAQDILLVGNDNRTDAQGNPLPENILKELRTTAEEGELTDTMILVRIPNGGERASAISFPRDTMVNLGNGYGEQKLNSAWGREKNATAQKLRQQGVTDPKQIEQQSTAAGQKFLVETIQKLSGVSIDHYAEVNLLGFYEITKAIGGVNVCLREPVNDSKYSGAVFPAGEQTIQGADALAFVRQRHGLPRGDLDRVVRQQVFMSGMAKKMLSSGTLSNPTKMADLVEALKDSIVLDKGWDVVSFAQQMSGITGGNIEFQTAPVELEGESGSEQVVAEPAEIKKFAENLLLPPEQRKAKEQADAAKEAQRQRITVDVYNASGKSNLANRVSQTLGEKGFTPGSSSNAQSMPTSFVQHAPGEQDVAKQVAESLGGMPIKQNPQTAPGKVAVYIGSDYQGPGARNLTGPKPLMLDGMQRTQPQPAQEQDSEQPITASGVPCVN